MPMGWGSLQKPSLLADYQQRVNTLKSNLDPALQNPTVSVVAHWSGGVLAYTTSSFSGAILQDLGFDRNPGQQPTLRASALKRRSRCH